ncbi:uncharacterized protein LOC113549616 [Rhopalosiphum maidis]|uniref:uncharacterized protein LOC113549616 n=1 Tax=Rhopalosiphum maidis TaxID=43146 RepID=UPI000EFDBA7F|nr:uncharacterized protein LOC113549616 [Rhopalosiphum maidis]
MEIPEKHLEIATIEYVQPKTKKFLFTSEVLGVTLYNQILCFDNCFFIVISQDNTFSCLSVAMTQRNSTDTISSAIFSTDPDSRSESIANTLSKSLKMSIPIYVSFNANIETIGLKDVILSLINFFESHSEIFVK